MRGVCRRSYGLAGRLADEIDCWNSGVRDFPAQLDTVDVHAQLATNYRRTVPVCPPSSHKLPAQNGIVGVHRASFVPYAKGGTRE